MRLAARMGRIAPSPILETVRRARELAEAGRDIIDLGIGEPDFDTPRHIKEAASAAMRAGDTKYGPVGGSAPLRDAIAEKFRRENGLAFAPNQITVTTGAKQAIFNAMLATLDDGDEVVIPAPYWASYPDIVRLCGARPVIVPCAARSGFKLTAETLERALTARTRWLLLNSPSNPSGAAYRRGELESLAEVLRRHPGVLVLSDDIYEHLLYDQPFATLAAAAPDLAARTLLVNGVSKAYAMTGWRIGYAAGPAALIGAMNTLQTQSTTHASTISQAAAQAALSGPQDSVADRREAFAARRSIVVAGLDRIPGISCRQPDGAFYVYPSCQRLIGTSAAGGGVIDDDRTLAAYLLETAGVAVTPGSAFGLSPHFRLSYAVCEPVLIEAIARIERACADLHAPDAGRGDGINPQRAAPAT